MKEDRFGGEMGHSCLGVTPFGPDTFQGGGSFLHPEEVGWAAVALPGRWAGGGPGRGNSSPMPPPARVPDVREKMKHWKRLRQFSFRSPAAPGRVRGRADADFK